MRISQTKGWSRSRRRGREAVCWRVELAPWLSLLRDQVLSVGFGDDGKGRGRRLYERKVDLPQSGSPRRRMVTVGGLSMDSDG